ncbi:hypothetical protein [Haladaptatus halobius]|uniref:hypothetical protein n=1 Tax=Haladaptatus halobius TaxID=2884875 RepID=UPI001D0BBC8B|nr:hypothetical protein [Haladaptatus halobius]
MFEHALVPPDEADESERNDPDREEEGYGRGAVVEGCSFFVGTRDSSPRLNERDDVKTRRDDDR